MGTPDPKLFPAPGAVPNSGAVNPLNPVQKAPVISQNLATPSIAAMTQPTTTYTPPVQVQAQTQAQEPPPEETFMERMLKQMRGY